MTGTENDEAVEYVTRDWSALSTTREFWSRRAAAARRADAETVHCPRCGAPEGQPCIAKAGVQMDDAGYHMTRWHRWEARW